MCSCMQALDSAVCACVCFGPKKSCLLWRSSSQSSQAPLRSSTTSPLYGSLLGKWGRGLCREKMILPARPGSDEVQRRALTSATIEPFTSIPITCMRQEKVTPASLYHFHRRIDTLSIPHLTRPYYLLAHAHRFAEPCQMMQQWNGKISIISN